MNIQCWHWNIVLKWFGKTYVSEKTYFILFQEMEFLASLERLHNDFSSFKKPTGTKFYPALTCKNLFNDHSHLKSGKFVLFELKSVFKFEEKIQFK